MHGAQCLLECLAAEQVRYIFGNPGSTEVPLLDTLLDYPGMEFVLTLHESTAVAMADGLARASGRPGVVLLHTAAGLANGLGNLYNAARDSSPLVVLLGNKETRLLGTDAFCELRDLPALVRPLTRWSWQVRDGESLPRVIGRAFAAATAPPGGPVFVEIPEDLWTVPVPPFSYRQRTWPKSGYVPDGGSLQAALEALQRAVRPVIIAGNQLGRSGKIHFLVALAEALGSPVFTESAFGLADHNFPTDHPLFQGPFNPSSPVVRRADLIFSAGAGMFVESAPPPVNPVPEGAFVIHLHPDPLEIGKNYPVDLPLVGDTAATLHGLLALMGMDGEGNAPPSGGTGPAFSSGAAEAGTGTDGPVTPAGLARALAAALPQEAIIVEEAIRSGAALLKTYPFRRPHSLFKYSGGYLGWGIGAAMGIRLARPDAPVIALLGDGSCMFGASGLWTAARRRLPVVFVVCKNRAYMAVKHRMVHFGGRATETGRTPGCDLDDPAPDFIALAAAHGLAGWKAANERELAVGLKDAVEAGIPLVIEVEMDQRAYL